MSKSWLACVVLVISAWTSTAFASLSSTPPPGDVDVGDVEVNAFNTALGTVNASSLLGDTLDHFHLTGAACGRFTITPAIALPHTITSATPMDFSVRFSPTARGTDTCTVAFHDASHGSIGTDFTITGHGVAQEIAAPATRSFGSVRVGNAAVLTVSANLVLGNVGDPGHDLQIDSLTLTGSGDFTITSAPSLPAVVSPAGTVTVAVQFDPSTPGLQGATLAIASNDPVTPVTTVTLSGTGTSAVIGVTDVAFGVVNLGQTSTQPIAVTNTAAAPVGPLRLASASIIGGAGWFTFESNGFSCLGSTSCTFGGGIFAPQSIGVRCAPPAGSTGTMTATVAFASDSDAGGENVSALSCETTSFDTTVTTLDFGDLRFDAIVSRTFCIQNTSQAPVQIRAPLAITPGAGTTTGELTASTTVKRQAVCGVGGTSQTLPQTLNAGEFLEVTVVANPNNRIGALDATLTITSDLAVNPTRVVTLVGNSTTAGLTLTPGSTLDFGVLDLQAAPSTRNITITNTGVAALGLAGFARSDAGSPNPHFTFALPPDTSLAAGETLTIAVTYTPTAVTTPDEEIVLSSTIAGVLGGPTSQTITIRGRGIDREIALAPAPVFPDTFRNPGDAAPVRPVTVTNLGAATLHITATMLTTADPEIWTLVDPDPIEIPRGASVDFLVRFAPKLVGTAPPATLAFTSDDRDEMVALVELSGNGIDRNVAFGAREIDLGLTGIGIPITVEDALVVASMDPDNGFLIRNIAIVGDDVFSVVDSPQNLELAASTTHGFAVTFTPESEGDFVATAQVFLDKDPVAQAEITIKGRAVFVDAHGGGGCATGDGFGSGAIVVVAIAIVGMRRRRHVVTGASGPGASVATAVSFALVSFALVPAVGADNVALSVFDPTPATTGTGFQLQSPEVGKDGDWVVSAIVSHATNPLVLDAVFDGKVINDDHVIERSTLLELGGAYAFLGRFEAGARMPIYAQDGQPLVDSRTMFSTAPASGTATGDLTLHGKARLWSKAGFAVASGLQLTLPTATERAFTGVDKPSARLLALAAFVPDTWAHRVTLSANAGFVLRATSRYANLEQGSGVAWGLGVSVRALDRVWVATEVFGDAVPSGHAAEMGGATTLAPIEWLAGVRYQPDHRFSIGLAGGRGLTRAAGSPELRGVLSLAYAPGAPMIRAIHEPGPARVDGDRDGDGIRDSADQCPNEAEDADLFDDSDGCPDLDNDQDGVADADDKCQLDPEDKDGFADSDGCPDPDNDADNVPDAHDTCPKVPEDKDGFEDLDGCPELDNDRDGIPDAIDKCINQPETINGIQDDDGCPDQGESIIILSPDRIETLDAILFTSGTKLAGASFNVLGQVAATLRAHPEIVRIRVACHVQPSQHADRDQELSDKRAQTIRDWLIQWGIDASRVEPRGLGGKQPLSPPEQRGSAAINDRIELIIVERK